MSDQSGVKAMGEPIDEDTLQDLYSWIDEIPLSRPKRNVSRDFSDGVMVAEVVRHFFPRYVELHNYTPANAGQQKQENWKTLNRKVFKKLSFEISDNIIRQVILCKPYVMEHVLMMLREKIEGHVASRGDGAGSQGYERNVYDARLDKPEADQNTHMMSSPGRVQNGVGNKQHRGKPTAAVSHSNSPGRPPVGRQANKPVHSSPVKNVQATPRQGMTKASSMNNISGSKNSTVPQTLYEENMAQLERKEQECLAKEETIQILQAKIRRLEQLIHLKDIRIEELQATGASKDRWK